ncbi:MAG: LysR family transcriptional regulator [Sulfitobacter sp.]
MDGSVTPAKASVRGYPLLFEMLRSFTTLAATLNLSHAVLELCSTRQTVRRHVAQLEELKGGPLFAVTDRQYALTELGRMVLPEALDLIARAEGWLSGQSQLVNGMQYLRREDPDGWFFFQQQQPIGKLFSSTSPLLPDVMKAWAEAGGNLEHEALKRIRPFCTVFRRVGNEWLFTEVGEKSSFVSWFGWTVSSSSIGRPLGEMPGGGNFGVLSNVAYAEVETNQSARLDHIHTVLPKGTEAKMLPISFERLLLGARFPDESFAMISAVRRTYDVDIKDVSNEMLHQMTPDMVM